MCATFLDLNFVELEDVPAGLAEPLPVQIGATPEPALREAITRSKPNLLTEVGAAQSKRGSSSGVDESTSLCGNSESQQKCNVYE